MDFAQFCTVFTSKIEGILLERSGQHVKIDKSDVKKVSKMFEEFSKYSLEQEDLLPFVNSAYMFFLLVIRYAKQFDESSYHQECQLTVKMALGTFLFVVDKTQTYSRIIKRVVTIIDILIKEFRQYGVIQEILIVYIGCLNSLEKNVLERLARKHKSIHLLADTAIDAHETSVQAAIIETVLKLSCTETPLLERMFPEVKMSLVSDVIIDYLKIRPILEKLNENSPNIFSMNCTSVMLDHYLVSEFEGATSIDEVWLDVDLPLKRLSFFCTPGFLRSFTDTQFGQATNWEVLSFQVEDCLETTFVYKEAIENLEIDIKIRTSSFNLFRNLKFHTIRHLVIQISKYSKKYEKFVKEILPQVFPNFLPEDFANTFEEIKLKSTDDDSTTKNKILDSGSVVLTEEDDGDDEMQEQLQALELSSYGTVKKTKFSRPQKIVDKSVSPISFTESVLAGKPKLKISRENMKRKISRRKKSKISSPKERKPIQTSDDSKSLVTDKGNSDLDDTSFSESVLAGKPKLKISRENMKCKISRRKQSKISSPKNRNPIQTSEDSKSLVTVKGNSDLDDTHLDSTSVVDLTEEDEDDIQEQLQALELSSDNPVKKKKCSRPQKIVDKSLSPISFSESVLAGKPKLKVSKMSTRPKPKISAPKKRAPKPLKISTAMAVSSTDDHPPKQVSPQITSKAESKEQDQNVEEASNDNNVDRCPLDEDLDLVVRDAAIDSFQLVQSKVKDWLNTCMSDQKESPVLLQGSPEFKIPEPRPVQYEETPASNVSSSNQPLDQQITKWLSEGHYEPSETTREFISQKMSGRTESLLETLARDDDKNTDIPPPASDMDVVTQSKETEGKESHLPIETNIINDNNNSDENNENQPNISDNSESSNIPLAQLAAAHLEKRNQKPLNTSHTPIVANVKIIEYGSISDDDISSAEARIRDIEDKEPEGNLSKQLLEYVNDKDKEQEGNLSKQLFEYIIDKEVVNTDSLAKPAVDEDAENHSPSTENSVNTQKTQRKQKFQSRADYLFDQLKANETKISMINETSTKNVTMDQLKTVNETQISVNHDTSATDNFSTKQSETDLSMAESKTRKRRLFNPNDLSYLENMITDDYINSKPEEKIPDIEIKERPSSSTKKAPTAKRGRKKKVQNLDDINSESVEKIPVIEIKERRRSSTKKPPVAKRGRKKKVQELDVDFSKLKTIITEPKPAVGTERPFQKVLTEWRSRNQAYKEQVKKQKLIYKSKKRRGKKAVVSSPSTESSEEPFGIPMEVLLNKRRCGTTTGETPVKRRKANDGTSKNIKVISNIVIKEADNLPPESNEEFNNLEYPSGHHCSYCELAVNDVHRVFLNYLDHAKTCKSKTFKRERFRKILNIIEKDFLHN